MNNEMGDAVSIIQYQNISEKLFTSEAGVATECNVLEMMPSGNGDYKIGRYIYDAGALPACITKLKYNDYVYDVPTESFIVDDEYGIYDLSADGKTMTFYGCDITGIANITTQTVTEGEGEDAVPLK